MPAGASEGWVHLGDRVCTASAKLQERRRKGFFGAFATGLLRPGSRAHLSDGAFEAEAAGRDY